MARVLGVVRVSVDRLEGTSPARQKEIIERAVELRDGAELIGWAEDLSVSASHVAPTDRPALGSWLRDRTADFDLILFWRIDRFVRRTADLADMVRWAEANGKGLASATEAFDLDTPLGKAMAYIISIFAEMEAQATSERVLGTKAYLRRIGRNAGGKAPYGYLVTPSPGGPGHVLSVDEASAEVAREAARRVTKGESVTSVAADLSRRGVPSPRDHDRLSAGREPLGAPFAAGSLWAILRSPALLGRVVHQRHTVPGQDGMPLVQAEPLLTLPEYTALQKVMDAASHLKQRTRTPSLLLNVASCVRCGGPLWSWSKANRYGTIYRYYRCSHSYRSRDAEGHCSAPRIRRATLDDLVESVLLPAVADVDRDWFTPGIRAEIALLETDAAAQCATALRFIYRDHTDEFDTVVGHYDGLADGTPAPGAARVTRELVCG
jgi:site-specific DNA recombinase